MKNSILMDAAAIPYSLSGSIGPAEIFTAVLIIGVIALSVAMIIRSINKNK